MYFLQNKMERRWNNFLPGIRSRFSSQILRQKRIICFLKYFIYFIKKYKTTITLIKLHEFFLTIYNFLFTLIIYYSNINILLNNLIAAKLNSKL